jgi:hypothetical protein
MSTRACPLVLILSQMNPVLKPMVGESGNFLIRGSPCITLRTVLIVQMLKFVCSIRVALTFYLLVNDVYSSESTVILYNGYVAQKWRLLSIAFFSDWYAMCGLWL